MSDYWLQVAMQDGREEELVELLLKLRLHAHCTRHYGGGREDYYVVHHWGTPISGKFSNRIDAINDAIRELSEPANDVTHFNKEWYVRMRVAHLLPNAHPNQHSGYCIICDYDNDGKIVGRGVDYMSAMQNTLINLLCVDDVNGVTL